MGVCETLRSVCIGRGAFGGRALPCVRRTGFTLIELLVVIAIIAILVSVGIGIFQQARVTAWKQKARDSARQIAICWNARLIQDLKAPAAGAFTPPAASDGTSITFQTTTNSMVVLGLLEQSADQRLNGMKDKWGNYFWVRLNTKGTGVVKSPLDDNTPIRANVVAWSWGPSVVAWSAVASPTIRSNSWIIVSPE